MQTLSSSDYKLLKSLVSLNQNSLRKSLTAFLERKYTIIYKSKDYLIAVGDIPVALVAHMDTVFKETPKSIYYDEKQGVLWSPEGLGADDRAGIFSILKILQAGYLPTVIFTADEEKGCLGAEKMIKDYPNVPVDLKYIIQLDRRGTNDCVFYECANYNFIQYVEDFGFVENFGSFSDISVICPEWGIAGVNLSVGYEDEHSYVETLHIAPLFATINKVKIMLEKEDIPFFEYVSHAYTLPYQASSIPGIWNPGDWEDEESMEECMGCHVALSEYDMIPVTRKNGQRVFYCPECCVKKVSWCEDCGETFEISSDKKYCNKCSKKHKEKKNKCITKRSKKNSTK